MKFAVIISKKDSAGMNIKGFLDTGFLEKHNAVIHLLEEESVYAENIDQKVKADLFIFATKHRSEKGAPSLSVHSPGNWAKAELGGQNRKLCIAPALYLREGLIKLNQLNEKTKLDFDVVQECTHHGPYLEKQAMFIEIGSAQKEWENKTAGKIIAETIHFLISEKPENVQTAFGIGGLHTTPNFLKLILDKNIALGHVCPKYMLEYLNKELILQAIEKTHPKNDLIILDWKGLKTEKQRIVGMLDELGLEYKRTGDFS